MRIILDTGVFFHPPALEKIRSRPTRACIPAVAYAERLRQLQRDGQSMAYFERFLGESGIQVEPFGREEGLRLLNLTISDEHWRRAARDALIAAHVGSTDELWTTNPKDFLRLGLLPSQVIAVGA